MPADTRSIVAAALFATLLFFAVMALGLGFFFFFLPSLPLFYIGLSRGKRACFASMVLTTLMLGGATASPVISLTFFVLIGLPVVYIIRLCLQLNEEGAPTPLGTIWLNLTLYACGAMALMTGFYAFEPENLPQMLARLIQEAFSNFPVEYAPAVSALATRSFLMLSITAWLWGIALYAHLWFAHSVLVRQQKLALRESIAFTPFALPTWLFSLIGICALASLIGGDSLQFLGKTMLITLALPYFFLGAAHMHAHSATWPNRKFFLFLLYFLIAAQLWPALGVAAWGFWQHLKNTNKRLPERGA